MTKRQGNALVMSCALALAIVGIEIMSQSMGFGVMVVCSGLIPLYLGYEPK